MPYHLLTEEEKTTAWFTDGSAHFADITQKQTGIALRHLSGTTLKDTGEGKSSQWAELQTVQFGYVYHCVIIY